jgi:hypothetical protein
MAEPGLLTRRLGRLFAARERVLGGSGFGEG